MNLDDLNSAEFWRNVSEDRYTQITTVIPTGRATNNTSGHLALSSDGMFMPEIVLEIDRLSRNAGLKGVRVRSMFDIDFYDALQSVVRNARNRESAETEGEDHCIDSNLVVVGTADVSIIALELLNAVESIEKYKMGCPKPYESALIKGGRGHLYSLQAEPNAGLLALYRNPWARQGQRVALFCGGVNAVGTMAANALLLDYLRGGQHGNNKYLSDVPMRVVDARKMDYLYSPLLSEDACVPRHDLRGIQDEIDIGE